MNGTTNSTKTFTFTPSDGLFIGLQGLIILLSLLAFLLMFLFRNQKPLKHRGISPYISIVGIWFLMVRLYFQAAGGVKTQSPESITYKFLTFSF
jgi:hypothetical protein